MKQKRLFAVVIALMLVCTALVLTACGNGPKLITYQTLTEPQLDSNQIAVIVKNGDENFSTYVVTIEGDLTFESSVADVLRYLKDNQMFNYVADDGPYGDFVTQIDQISQDESAGRYVMCYTSVENDCVGAFASVECGTKVLGSSNYGVSSMKIQSGAVVLFQAEQY